jgi:TIR domain
MSDEGHEDQVIEDLVGQTVQVVVKAVRPGLDPALFPQLVTVNPKVRRFIRAFRASIETPRLIMGMVGVSDPFERIDLVTPNEADLQRIPRWALVSFAGRCAQNALQHLVIPGETPNLEEHFSAVDQAVAFALDCAEAGTVGELPPLGKIQFDTRYPDPAVVAASCAALTPFGAARADTIRLAALAADHANWAAWYHSGAATPSEAYGIAARTNTAIWSDFGRLSDAASRDSWAENTLVPRKFYESDKGPRRPTVFICHAKQDSEKAREIFHRLRAKENGLDPWLDKVNLVLGDDWEAEIRKAVAHADCFVICLRPGFDDTGFRQQEVRWALDALRMRPPGRGFLIPFFLEPCPIPEWLAPFHAGQDLEKPTSFEELLAAVKKHCRVGERSR